MPLLHQQCYHIPSAGVALAVDLVRTRVVHPGFTGNVRCPVRNRIHYLSYRYSINSVNYILVPACRLPIFSIHSRIYRTSCGSMVGQADLCS